MVVVKALVASPKGPKRVQPSVAALREKVFDKVCEDFFDFSEVTSANLAFIARNLDLKSTTKLVEFGGSLTALYLAFHSEIAESHGFEPDETQWSAVKRWRTALAKQTPGIFVGTPNSNQSTATATALAAADIIFVNNALMGAASFAKAQAFLEEHIEAHSTLVLTANPWPRPSAARPAPFTLLRKVICPEANVGNGLMTLFLFSASSATSAVASSSAPAKSTPTRARRHTDIFSPPTKEVSTTPTRATAKRTSRASLAPSTKTETTSPNAEVDDASLGGRTRNAKRPRDEVLASPPKRPVGRTKKQSSVVETDDETSGPAPPKRKAVASAKSPARASRMEAEDSEAYFTDSSHSEYEPKKKVQAKVQVVATPKPAGPRLAALKNISRAAGPASAPTTPAGRTRGSTATVEAPGSARKTARAPINSPIARNAPTAASTTLASPKNPRKPVEKKPIAPEPIASPATKRQMPSRNATRNTAYSDIDEALTHTPASATPSTTSSRATPAKNTAPRSVSAKKAAASRNAVKRAAAADESQNASDASTMDVEAPHETSTNGNAMDVSTESAPRPAGWFGWLFGGWKRN